MPKIFFTSDTHFNQERTFIYSRRDMYFKDINEMNDEMVKRWNNTVSSNDIVFHLGDFGDFSFAPVLNGKINLLYGNYERDKGMAPDLLERSYFNKIYTDKSLILREINAELVHEPEYKRHNEFYLFGHIHEKQKVKRNGLNVGVDVNNFTPVSLETIEFYRNAIQNIYDENCFKQY